MNVQVKRNFKRILVVILIMGGFFAGNPLQSQAATYKTNEEFNTTHAVKYKDIRKTDGKTKQAIRVMEINVSDQNTFVDVGVPSVMNKLQRTTTHALSYHRDGHYVVGAINASFFHLGTAMNLVSKDNELVLSGRIYNGKDKYVNEPIAFGINRNGLGIIDHYNLAMSYSHNGNNYPITTTNTNRSTNETVLYTPYYKSKTTGTNQYGTEVVVEFPAKPTLELGKTMNGTVTAIRAEGDTTTTTIPKNGVVLSGNGTGSTNLKNIQIGDAISITIGIDDKWTNSSMMLASGPMLVKDGKVSLTMDPKSPNAASRAPRTAVAIDKTGKKVFFVTVDGRQSGYSNGVNLTEFANELIRLGAYRALNLDGGGSTTMAVRYFGSDKIRLANKPSDGSERAVATILMAISTSPLQIFKDVKLSNWAEPSITTLHKKGVISGFPDGSFKPNEPITRAQAAIMLTKELGININNVKNPGFKDVTTSHKYYKEIAAVTNAGYFTGKGNSIFGPNDTLTRAEIAILLQKIHKLADENKAYFPDVKSNHWAYTAVNAIAKEGITSGYPDGTFKLNNSVTRAEFSVFLN